MTHPNLLSHRLLLVLALMAGPALAQTPAEHHGHNPAMDTTAAPASTTTDTETGWTEAEVRRLDAKAGKLTLKHGDIQNLGMPPMTMVFQVQNPQILTKIKVGDRVRFTADHINGAYTVLQIETLP